MSKRRKLGIVFILIGSVFILCAVGLIIYNIWDDNRAQESVKNVLSELKLPEKTVEAEDEASDDPEVTVPDYLLDPNREMPTITVDGYKYIGKVTVPSIELELPVMEKWDYVRLKIAPCRYSGSAYLNNLIICAHNYASVFGRLKNLSAGDLVMFTDAQGNVFRYEVEQLETLSPSQVKDMKSGDWDLTLFTCTVGALKRIAVRCERI